MKNRIVHSALLWLIALSALAQSSNSASQAQTQSADDEQPPSSHTLVLPPDTSVQPVSPQPLMVPPSAPLQGQVSPQAQGLQLPQGQTAMPVPPQGQAPAPPVGAMYAMRASGAVPQKLDLDEKLKPVASALKSLPFTSYEAISVNDQVLPWGQETLFPVNALYAMHVTPLTMEANGAISLRARVEMLQGETFINALKAEARAFQNQALLFRGMPLGRDELVIVLLVGVPPENQNQNGSSEEEQSETEGEQEEKKSESESNDTKEDINESQEGETTQEQQPPPSESAEGEQEEPEGVENLDALLESLDDIDREEQVKERNQRGRIDFKGDWW